MGFFRVNLKNGKKGTAKEHCDYINREGHYSSGDKAKELVEKGTVNMPAWATSANEFFSKADLYERVRASAYKSFEIALPCELTHKQIIDLVEKILRLICANKVAAWAIHNKRAVTANVDQIHIHIMVSERMVTDSPEDMKEPEKFFKRYNKGNPERGGYKKDRRFAFRNSKNLKELREKIAVLINDAYHEAGIPVRVSAKRLAEQKIEATQNQDGEMEDFLSRLPSQYIPYSKFKQYQKSIEQSGLMEPSELIPMISLLNSDTYQELITPDFGLENFLQERIMIQIKKYKLLKLQAERDERAFDVLLKNFNGCTIGSLRKPLAELGEKIRSRFDENQRYINIVDLLYKTDTTNMIASDYASYGLARKISRAKQRLKKLQEEKNGLVLIKKYSPEDKINVKIETQEALIKILKEKYDALRNLPETIKRYKYALANLMHKREQRIAKNKIRKEENRYLQEICQELPKLLTVANTGNQIVFSKKAEEIIYIMNSAKDVKSLYENFQELKRQFQLFAGSEILQVELTEYRTGHVKNNSQKVAELEQYKTT